MCIIDVGFIAKNNAFNALCYQAKMRCEHVASGFSRVFPMMEGESRDRGC